MAIKMKSYAAGVDIVNNNDIQRRLLGILLASFGLLAFLYVLFLGTMVFNIVERRNVEAESRTLGNEVQDLESSYLSMSSGLDTALSSSMGFKETKISFATRKPLKTLGSAALLKNEI